MTGTFDPLFTKVREERDEWRGLYEHGLEDRNELLARIVRLEAAIGQLMWDAASTLAQSKGYQMAKACFPESAYPVNAPYSGSVTDSIDVDPPCDKETPARQAHSKSEYKRLTALGVDCTPPETR